MATEAKLILPHIHKAKYVDDKLIDECDLCGHDIRNTDVHLLANETLQSRWADLLDQRNETLEALEAILNQRNDLLKALEAVQVWLDGNAEGLAKVGFPIPAGIYAEIQTAISKARGKQ